MNSIISKNADVNKECPINRNYPGNVGELFKTVCVTSNRNLILTELREPYETENMAVNRENKQGDSLKDEEQNMNMKNMKFKVECIVKGYQECEFDVNIGE